MSGHRFEIDASAGPAREGRVGGGAVLLVRVRLFDGPGVANARTGEAAGQPDAFCDLAPREVREFALQLLTAAEQAEQRTMEANYWEPSR